MLVCWWVNFELIKLNEKLWLNLGDALLKSAISLIADIQKQLEYAQNLDLSLNLSNNVSRLGSLSGSLTTMSAVEKYLNEYLCNFMSTLLIVPDNPEQGVIYLLTGLVNLIQKHINWENIEIKFNLLANAFVILAALKQENYLYHIHEGTRLQSNYQCLVGLN